jgi:hypothetical protein
MGVVIMFMKHDSLKYMRQLKQMIIVKDVEPSHGFYHTHTGFHNSILMVIRKAISICYKTFSFDRMSL